MRAAVTVAAVVLVLTGAAGLASCDDEDSGANTLPSTPSARSGPASADERESMTTFAKEALAVVLHRGPTAEEYGEDVDEATQLMTPGYAKRFRSLALASRNEVVGNKLSVEADVLGAGIVSATPIKGRVLVFADQQSTQDGGRPATTQQAVVMTLVRDGAGWLVSNLETSRTNGADEPDPDRRRALEAATRVARLLVNIDYRTVDADLAKITALGTGDFRDEYDDATGDAAGELVDNESVMTGLVFAAGVVSEDDDSATVLVATNGQVSNTSTDGLLVSRSFRMQLHLTKDGDRWLTDTLDFV